MSEVKKIALWSGPRNISTALMYSFANRSDTAVVDEPLFGYFLKHTGVWRPSRKEVLATMETNAINIMDTLLNPPTDMPVYFMKHMANHLIDLNLDFLANFENVLLIRDPKDMLLSYSKNVKEPTLLDTAYKMQVDLLDFFTERGMPYVILNAKNVLLNPERQLKILCEKLNISFQDSMLEWEAGSRQEDGIWAKYWYDSVHKSTGFGAYREKDQELPLNLISLYDECMYYYAKLEQLALT
ncbi:MAG TPA: sulfotransferase family protein [Flavobacteriales bacterium]|nr:sulfotransferase family protein [Flavobacteriales bacterium]